MPARILAKFEPHVRSLLRIVAGFTFSLHGFQKALGWLGGMGGAHARTYSLLWTAGVIETVGGLLILAGLGTRCIAFVLCGEMAVAYFRAHYPRGFWPLLNGGELAVLYCLLFLYFAVAGPGPWSLDRMFRRD